MYYLFKIIKVPLLVSSIVLTLLLLLTYTWHQSTIWQGYTLSTGIEYFFCEYSRMNSLVRGPLNTISNLPFLFFGIVMIILGNIDRQNNTYRNLLTAYPIYSYLYGACCIFAFAASTFFHASLIKIAQHMDMSGVYALSLMPLIYNLHRIYNIRIYKTTHQTTLKALQFFLALFMLFLALLTALKWKLPAPIVIPILIGLIILSTLYVRRNRLFRGNNALLATAVLCIVLGIACYALDMKKLICDQDSWIQPHAIWHIFSAASAFLCYCYWRSEQPAYHFK